MSGKVISGDCNSCESSFDIAYEEMLVSQELPEHCPFCGEPIEDVREEYIEDIDDLDNEEWD